MKIVGVLGGMGPAATVDFLARLLAATPAVRDEDHLRVLMDMNPRVPNRNRAAAGDGPSPAAVLADMARGLERQGAQLLAMPCNAAHAYAPDIEAAVTIPFVSMIEATGEAIAATGARRIGLLAVDATIASGLYQPHLPEPVLPGPAEQARLMALVYRIKAGATGAAERAEMTGLAEGLVAAGAEAVLAACTEVPLVLDSADLAVPLLVTTEILTKKVIKVATT